MEPQTLDSKRSRRSNAPRFSADQLIDKLAIPTFVIDDQHRITHWNLALSKASGLSAREMIGTTQQWKPFYSHPRPTLADIIIDGGENDRVAHFYTDKFKASGLIDGAYAAEDFFPDIGTMGEWLSFTAAPLLDEKGHVAGAIETMVSITDRKKAELALAERERHYRELSIIDDLTQLFNARHLHRELDRHIDLCRRYAQPMAMVLFDLDHFKKINDNHGHLFGDKVLRAFGELLRTHIRSADDAFRYGGEEFIVLMPFIDEKEAVLAAQRIRDALAQTLFITDDGQQVRLTVSAGVTRLRPDDDYNRLLKRTDDAMYAAKQQGRDRIVLG